MQQIVKGHITINDDDDDDIHIVHNDETAGSV